MKILSTGYRVLVLVLVLAVLASACSSGGGGGGDGQPETYSIGGTISGLNGQVLLQINGRDDLLVSADGVFSFPTRILNGETYDVTVGTQPSAPNQVCTIDGGSGEINGADVSSIEISCITNTHVIGGVIDGLVGTVVLQNNAGENLALDADGTFSFMDPIEDGTNYEVTILSQPATRTCLISNGSGFVNGADITGISVTCSLSAPELSLLPQSIKTFHFSWETVADATEYRLLEDADGISGYSELAVFESDTLDHDHEVFLPSRINARYILQACDGETCVDSGPVIVSGNLAEAIGYLKASNTGADDWFGWSVGLSGDGNTLAIGAPYEDSRSPGINGDQDDDFSANSNIGAVYVFVRNGPTWEQQAYVKASNSSASGIAVRSFGWSVALSADGNTLAVGARLESYVLAQGHGAVYVFTRSAGDWSEHAYITSSVRGDAYHFGGAVALSADGNTLAVGAEGEASAATGIDGNDADDSAPFAGAVYVFVRDEDDWNQEAYIKASETATFDLFGSSIALAADGNTLAVGARGANLGGTAYVFMRNTGIWAQHAVLFSSNNEPGDVFGGSVALSADGSTLAVGAYREDSSATGINGNEDDNSVNDAGAVYVFTRNDTQWIQQAYLKASTAGGNWFGTSIALSSSGNILAVGAPEEQSNATGIGGDEAGTPRVLLSGAVYVFVRDAGTWNQQAYVKASNTGLGASFGHSVTITDDGQTMAVGAYRESSNATSVGGNQENTLSQNSGAAYLY